MVKTINTDQDIETVGTYESENILTVKMRGSRRRTVRTFKVKRKWFSEVMEFNLEEDSGKPLLSKEIKVNGCYSKEQIIRIHQELVARYLQCNTL